MRRQTSSWLAEIEFIGLYALNFGFGEILSTPLPGPRVTATLRRIF
jgi:hypothetical protein